MPNPHTVNDCDSLSSLWSMRRSAAVDMTQTEQAMDNTTQQWVL